MKPYLCIFFALILFLAYRNFLQAFHWSSREFDNPAVDRSFSSAFDLGEKVDETQNDGELSPVADVKYRSDNASDAAGVYSAQTLTTTPQNITLSLDFLKATSTLKVSMLPGDLSNSTIYHCGYNDARDIYEHIYPEHKRKIRNATPMNRRTVLGSTENDVLLVGFGGRCGAPPKLTTNSFSYHFKGTVIQINRESFTDENAWQDPKNSSTIPKNQYHLGHVGSGCQSLRIFYMAQFLLLQEELWDFFRQTEKKPVSSRERFLIYTAGNCVDFRQSAFDAISSANPSLTVEYAGGCHGKMNLTNVAKYNPPIGRGFNNNWKFMREFRFCLVMENSYVDGYITEKILLAFAGGCIPVYYGTVEVFDIFNPKSFIYYDVENPKYGLNEIFRLENNATAYDEVMAEPILLEGNKTIQNYFSLSDEIIPNAMLKKRIREMVYYRCR